MLLKHTAGTGLTMAHRGHLHPPAGSTARRVLPPQTRSVHWSLLEPQQLLNFHPLQFLPLPFASSSPSASPFYPAPRPKPPPQHISEARSVASQQDTSAHTLQPAGAKARRGKADSPLNQINAQ